MTNTPRITVTPRVAILLTTLAFALAACGGGADPASAPMETGAPLATGATTLELSGVELPPAVASQTALPSFHVAPLLLDTPDDSDRIDHHASARRGPHRQSVPAEFRELSTRRLTVDRLESTRRERLAAVAATGDGTVAPLATPSVVATYSPAQIRAAYGMNALPASATALTASQAALLGAGQTIYIVDAMHDPNAAAELAAFNQKFGLPACTTRVIAPGATLPLAAASTAGCELSVVYSTPSGGMTAAAPAYHSGWAMEIALDVQWAHATAPLARIVLIEAATASLGDLIGAVQLANAMGAGIVSMSFGANEGNWTASVDAAFARAGMSYFAATGDSGTAVSWPAVSPNVIAVSGTSLAYSGVGARSESVWSGTGGGTSLYTPTPVYQSAGVPGLGNTVRRSVADVAFNADPSTGQYVAVMPSAGGAVSWLSVGGTSLSTPQWAGLTAVANAVRAQLVKPVLGAPHPILYGQIASVPGTYASAFADIVSGANGACATCAARKGYDPATGLGTPNVASLIPAMTGAAAGGTAPVVTSAAITGRVGTALTFTVSVAAANPVAYTLSGAPAGMTIGSTGNVAWPTPVAGSFPVTVVARDSKTGLTGQGVYTVTIAAPVPPVVTGGSIAGKVGVALTFAVPVTSTNAVTFSLAGAPAGMTVANTGVVLWPSPALGKWTVAVVAKDTLSGLTGQNSYTVTIAPTSAPAIAGGAVTGKPGATLTFSAAASASNPVVYSLSGNPPGMTIGATGVVTWPNPVISNFGVIVMARDTRTGLVGQGVYTVRIAAVGPVIATAPISGVAGRSVSGTFTISDPGATALWLTISGAPMGMTFSASGLTFTATWPNPVTGTYALRLSLVDQAGLTTTATIPITIAAR